MNTLHPDAKQNFDARGLYLLDNLDARPLTDRKEKGQPSSRWPEFFVGGAITQDDIIGEVRTALVDPTGKETAKYFVHNAQRIGLFNEDHLALRKLAEGIQRTDAYRDVLTAKTVADLIFDWLKSSYERGKARDSLTDYIEQEAPGLINDQEVWIPIFEPVIHGEHVIAGVTCKSITPAILDAWERQWLEKTQPEERDSFSQTFRRIRQKLQGRSAFVGHVRAELPRAYELTLEKTQRALTVLRLFSPGILFPEYRVNCVPLGHERLSSDVYFSVSPEGARTFREGASQFFSGPWLITPGDWHTLQNAGFKALNDLFSEGKPKPFQQELVDAIMLYSRAALTLDPTEKLLHVCVALESVLLRDPNEPIQENLAYRVARLSGNDREERTAIARNVKSVYDLRSRYMHHGHSIDDLKTMEEFLVTAWTVFRNLSAASAQWHDRLDFLSKVDQLKFQ